MYSFLLVVMFKMHSHQLVNKRKIMTKLMKILLSAHSELVQQI